MELCGRAALVTGAAKRVGRAIALAIAGRGADVVLHYKTSVSEVRATAEGVERLGRRAVTIHADLAQPTEVEALADRAVQAFGTIDILVNNAALFLPNAAGETHRGGVGAVSPREPHGAVPVGQAPWPADAASRGRENRQHR
jgi:NAD(P)-dependent dehydrogenase (short-subunit alcohol dehydrogenase family)